MTSQHAVLWTILLAACSSEDPGEFAGQFGEEDGLECVEASRSTVAVDEQVTVSAGRGETAETDAQSVIDAHTGDRTATLTWGKTSEETEVTVSVTSTGAAALVVYEPTDASLAHLDPCPVLLQVELDVSVNSDDGRLDDTFRAEGGTSGDRLYVEETVSPLGGSLDPQAMAPGDEPVEPDAIVVNLALGLDFSGQIIPVRTDVPGEDVQALGTWPGELEEE